MKSSGLSDDLSTSRVFIFFVAKKTICHFGLQQAEFQKRWKLICSVPSAESSRIYWVQRFPPNTEEHMSPSCKNSLSHLTCFSFQCAFSTITNRAWGLRDETATFLGMKCTNVANRGCRSHSGGFPRIPGTKPPHVGSPRIPSPTL